MRILFRSWSDEMWKAISKEKIVVTETKMGLENTASPYGMLSKGLITLHTRIKRARVYSTSEYA
jgi:hypothetical protein